MNPTRAEINLTHLEFNFKQVKKHLASNGSPKTKICGVVKANAYGHGIEEISKKLVSIGADFLGVANYDEAIRLRKLIPDTPILVFGTLIHSKLQPESYVARLLEYELTATVASLDTARFLDEYSRKLGKKFKIHIEVDTGMKRIGFDVKRALKNILYIGTLKNIFIEGIFTHFATAEDKNKAFAKIQLVKFMSLLERLRKEKIDIPIVHSANSGAVLDMEDSYFDMVRPGIILYGYYPSNEVKNKIELKPVMSLKSKLMFIKKVEAKTSISYGRKYFTRDSVFIGSIPVGYGDGYGRLLTNKAKVAINKKLYPVAGAVTMDWTMVNLGQKHNVKTCSDVLLIGKENGFDLGADKIAKLTKSIPYEVCCAVADRVQRVFIDD